MKPETLADLESERDRLIEERDYDLALARLEAGHWPSRRDQFLVGAGIQNLNQDIDDLTAVIDRWQDVAENEAKLKPVLLGHPPVTPTVVTRLQQEQTGLTTDSP